MFNYTIYVYNQTLHALKPCETHAPNFAVGFAISCWMFIYFWTKTPKTNPHEAQMFRALIPRLRILNLPPAFGRAPARKYVGGPPLYEQGQSPAPKIREYFYYIDHEGFVSY